MKTTRTTPADTPKTPSRSLAAAYSVVPPAYGPDLQADDFLRTEQDTPEVQAAVLRSARRLLRNDDHLTTAFEHGQWWVTDLKTGAQWSVVDTEDDFDFEQVTEGDEAEEVSRG